MSTLDKTTVAALCRTSPWELAGKTYEVEVSDADLTSERGVRSQRMVANYGWYEPIAFKNFLVHNLEVASLLEKNGTAEGLKKLRQVASERGVFAPTYDDYGLVVTSTASEIDAMNTNRWITDSIHTLALVEDPYKRATILNFLASFYCNEVEQNAFREILKNPELFRDHSNASYGVAHIFRVEQQEDALVLTRDETWENNKRLESHGLALQAFSQCLTSEDLSSVDSTLLCKAVASLALYFQAIEYPTAPSAGTWEEVPLPGGLSWDTEAIRQGYVAVRQLLFGSSTGQIDNFRSAVNEFTTDLIAETGYAQTPFTTQQVLEELIESGTKQVRHRVLLREEAPGMRGADASLAFIAPSDVELSDAEDLYERTVETVRGYLSLLKFLETKLVRDNGMLRYEAFSKKPGGEKTFFDSYLNLNYWLSLDEDGLVNPVRTEMIKQFESSDASDLEAFAQRAELAVSGREAEWFLVTEMSRGYAKQAERLDLLEDTSLTTEQRKIMSELRQTCEGKAVEFLQRGYGRITPRYETTNTEEKPLEAIKSNGEKCYAWALPEAYEWVRVSAVALGETTDSGYMERALPGANTSLAWAAASLQLATDAVIKILEK